MNIHQKKSYLEIFLESQVAKKKKKAEPPKPQKPERTEGRWYWCVNCGHHGDYGSVRKRNVKCEMCEYEEVSLYTLEEINDEWLDNIWLDRFKTKKQMEKPETTTESKKTKEKSLKEKLAEIKKL